MTVRMQRLDANGAPIGEPLLLEGASLSWEPNPAIEEPCQPVIIGGLPRVSFTVQIATPKGLARLLLGPRLALKQQRAARHRARIVVVPKRRRKHGRVGVYR